MLQIVLLYISSSNVITTRLYSSGNWAAKSNGTDLNLGVLLTDPSSRSLGLALSWETQQSHQLFLVFKALQGDITVLHGTVDCASTQSDSTTIVGLVDPTCPWNWTDLSRELKSSAFTKPVVLDSPFSIVTLATLSNVTFDNQPTEAHLPFLMDFTFGTDKIASAYYNNGTFKGLWTSTPDPH